MEPFLARTNRPHSSATLASRLRGPFEPAFAEMEQDATPAAGELLVKNIFLGFTAGNLMALVEGSFVRGKCSNPDCEKMQMDSPNKYKKCKQCRTVSYCSKACQVTHWKRPGEFNHARECRRIVAGREKLKDMPVMREGGRKRSTKGVYLALPVRKQQDITDSIISKWNDDQLRQPWLPPGNFTRFRDGNRKNWARSNAETVDIVESFKHLEVWDINWDCGLTAEEIAVVCDVEWQNGIVSMDKE